jgi:ribosomal protein L21
MYINDHQNSMSWRRLVIALVAGLCLVSATRAQSPPVSAAAVMNEVVANELTDRVQQRKWLYLIDRRDGKQTLTEQQVDTKDGPIYRVLAIDGVPLNQNQRQQDNARMDRLLHDPVLQLKLRLEQEEDETKLEKVLRLMPQAFLYDYDGVEGNLLKIKFRPNNNYNPPTYEARVVHAMAGTVYIDAQHKRLAKFYGRLNDRVEFGYGFLGYIDKGGTIEIGRVQVDASEWKTTFVNIQLSGRLVFFKTISKQEYETRSGFRAVPGNLSLLAASQLLAH